MNKGAFYEDKAVEFLILKGYKILEKNFRVKGGEIDIIAKEIDTICFIEVKARNRDFIVAPEEAINVEKKRRIIRAAKRYITLKGWDYFRFDFVGIVDWGEVIFYKLIRNAFTIDELPLGA